MFLSDFFIRLVWPNLDEICSSFINRKGIVFVIKLIVLYYVMLIFNLGNITGCLLSRVYFEGWGSLGLTHFIARTWGITNCLLAMLDC
jgi:hypothetical protein